MDLELIRKRTYGGLRVDLIDSGPSFEIVYFYGYDSFIVCKCLYGSVSLHCPSSFLLKAEFLIGALAAFSRTVKDRVAGRFMVVLSQPLKICSFASRTCDRKEEKRQVSIP